MSAIRRDLEKKMVFVTGPRQVGKTWLAREVAASFKHVAYLNEDHADDRSVIRSESWPRETELLILDEIHKMPGWKNYLKGVYDTKPDHLRILVTGSARLETFRKGGDALSGRFFTHRLLPFSVAELAMAGKDNVLQKLLERGGFPEPFLAERAADAERWRREYADSLIRTDILDFERVHDIRAMQMLLDLLRRRVGSLVSFASLARDINLSPMTVARYVGILEALYIVFRVTPFSRSIARSLRKEPKVYFFDTGLVENGEAARLENLVAMSLLKHCLAIEDAEGVSMQLHFLRTKDGREADFCMVRKTGVQQVVEVKLRERKIDRNLRFFCGRYGFPGVQIVKDLRIEREEGGLEVRDAEAWLSKLLL